MIVIKLKKVLIQEVDERLVLITTFRSAEYKNIEYILFCWLWNEWSIIICEKQS